MHEFLPGVLTWPWFSEPHGYDFNGTLVRHEGGNLCIDPVDPSEEVLDRLAKEGVARILITNRNHTRGANVVRERTGASVSIHTADAGYARDGGNAIEGELAVGQRSGQRRSGLTRRLRLHRPGRTGLPGEPVDPGGRSAR